MNEIQPIRATTGLDVLVVKLDTRNEDVRNGNLRKELNGLTEHDANRRNESNSRRRLQWTYIIQGMETCDPRKEGSVGRRRRSSFLETCRHTARRLRPREIVSKLFPSSWIDMKHMPASQTERRQDEQTLTRREQSLNPDR